ncbi:MAG: hypothetical protein LQ346_007094 [Caloplaca aetnensis]|nr:MAG: hypothetical protein LQ346_007094 [Caloplaca aetnensis]
MAWASELDDDELYHILKRWNDTKFKEFSFIYPEFPESDKETVRDSGEASSQDGPNLTTSISTSSDQESPSNDFKEPVPRTIHGWRWVVAMVTILSTTFLFALDNTIVADIQPSIVNQFHDVEHLPWFGVGFGLGSTAVLPWGKAYGVYSVKWLFIATVLLFEAGSVVCGAAPSVTALIIGRVLAGVGGSGMYSGCLTYISVMTSNLERPMYMAGIAVAWGAGTVLGPVVGGAFADSSATWRWAFYINLVIGAVLAPAYFLILPDFEDNPGMPLLQKFRKTDWIGILVLMGGCTFLFMAMNFGGSVFAWDSSEEIAFWTMTGVFLILMALVTYFHPFVSEENKLYPSHFLRKFELVNLQMQLFMVSGIMFALTYYLPLFFQFTKGDSPLKAAVRILPFIVMIVFFSLLNGALMPKYGYYMPWYIVGSVIALIGSALMCKWNPSLLEVDEDLPFSADTVKVDTSISAIYGYTVLAGIGTGLYMTAGFSIVPFLVAPHDINNAIGFMAVAQVIGGNIFLSMAGCMYQNYGQSKLRPFLTTYSAEDVSMVIAGTSNPLFQSLSPDLKAVVIEQINTVMSYLWAVMIAGAAISVVLAPFLSRKKIYATPGVAPAA